MQGVIEMNHGSGGRAMQQLIERIFKRHFDNPLLNVGDDAAKLPVPAGRLAITTDAHVISPLSFPGGDIGALSVHGSINDVAMVGARPLCLTAAFILEEGLKLAELERIVASMAAAARAADVPIVTGDTKVVERGHGDGIYITTTAVGIVPAEVNCSGRNIRPSDAILLSGPVGDHGIAVLAHRQGLELNGSLQSDSAALHGLVADMVAAAPEAIHALRDPTRGGLAATLNELAAQSGVGMQLDETAIPVRPEVRAACELLGLDLLQIANEGKLICICRREESAALLAAMHAHPLGRDAVMIGEVIEDERQLVVMQTTFGGRRVIDWPAGEPLPRIC